MKTVPVTTATSEPVSLGEAKRHLRLSTDTGVEDTLLNGLITASRIRCEDYTGRRLLTQTHKVYLDEWPLENHIDLPYPPLLAIQSSSVSYKDSEETLNLMLASGDNGWEVDIAAEPGRLVLDYNNDWPSVTLWDNNPISIQFICGYGTTDAGDATKVPEPLKLGMKMLIGHWYENRENTIVTARTGGSEKIPDATDALWYPYRIWDWRF